MFFSIWKLSSNSWNEWNKYKEVWSWSSGSTISGHPLGPWAGLSPNWEDLSDCRPTQDQKGGEAGYFYRVVPNVLDINRLLTDLTVKEEPDLVQWKEPCEWAFCQVKQVVLFGGLLLHSPDFFLPFVLQTDASDRGPGAVFPRWWRGRSTRKSSSSQSSTSDNTNTRVI